MQSVYETYSSVLFAAEMVGCEFSHTSFIDYIYTFTCCYYSPDKLHFHYSNFYFCGNLHAKPVLCSKLV